MGEFCWTIKMITGEDLWEVNEDTRREFIEFLRTLRPLAGTWWQRHTGAWLQGYNLDYPDWSMTRGGTWRHKKTNVIIYFKHSVSANVNLDARKQWLTKTLTKCIEDVKGEGQ